MKEMAVTDTSKPQELFQMAEQLIQQTHYEHLDSLPQCVVREEIARIRPGDVVCLFQITELVCSREEGSLMGLTTVLNALHACKATVMLLLQCREGRSELFLGAVNKKKYQNLHYLNTIRDILSTGLEGNLPGTELREVVTRSEIESKLQECLDDGFDTQCITSVSCTAAQFGDREPVSGMEKLLGAVGKKNFSLLLLADPVENAQLQTIRQGYENIGNYLSELESMSVSCQSSLNTTVSKNYSDTFTKSIGKSISQTQSHTVTNGWSEGESAPLQQGKGTAARKAATGIGALAVTALTESPMAGYLTMNVVSSLFGDGGSKNNGENGSVSNGDSDTVGRSEQESSAHQEGSGISQGKTEGITVQTARKDYHVKELLSKLESYLNWLKRCENYGMFDCCAYIVSGNASTNLLVASQYQALMQGGGDMNQPVTINTWTSANGVEQIRESLLHLMHPAMSKGNMEISPAMLISGRELARQIALPRESVVGVSVMEYAPFGREVVRKSPLETGSVARVGVVTHMGKENPGQPVLLDMQSLASHTFIAGTNGSGKSNTIFRLLEEMLLARIPFMVIEPAKGEYKNVFGKEEGVNVYGTNCRKTPLLRLNPFWFNEDIDVKEHIARLMDVFNACWPMYAAMPSVLNTAIENAYKNCGWNLETSRCIGKRIFPTVQDVLEALAEKMDATAFSDEVKGNYVGALTTRLEALCSGIYADIFAGADLGDKLLFESNVLIDLSRAGSPEISAMVMGMLLIRLREYRMSEGALNHPLRHITVLEEAHHLLRKTSVSQSEEGSNMMGKAVEMISNAIAEMRSYGDGFIIADQSPGLLDTSVLRNTNTKIIMRLPEGRDRELVGDTIGLTAKQSYELSRLKTGVCAIYQKDWLEAVLCKVDKACHEEVFYTYEYMPETEDERRKKLVQMLLYTGADKRYQDKGQEPMQETVLQSAVSGKNKRKLLSFFGGKEVSWRQRAEFISELVPIAMERPLSLEEERLEEWLSEIISANDLENRVGKENAKMAVAAHAWKNSQADKHWKRAASWLYPEGAESKNMKGFRGVVLALLCGIEEQENTVTEGKLRICQKELAESDRTDRELADLLLKYQQTGEPRKKGELVPYSGIAWSYAGGEAIWNKAYDALENKNYAQWDHKIRDELKKRVEGSDVLLTELMSLLLQYKGQDKNVRKFYYPWLSWAKRF